jgi:O-antigen ligase
MAVGAIFHRVQAQRWLMVGVVVFITTGLVLSGSVTGMLAAVVGVTVLVVRGNAGARALVGLAIVAVAFFVGEHFLGHGSLTPLQRLQQATGGPTINGQDSFSQRLSTWGFAWSYIASDPIVGRGLDAASGLTNGGIFTIHNLFLLAWFQGGLATLAGVVTAVAWAVREGWRRSSQVLIELPFAAFIGAITYAMTGPVLFDRFFWFPALMILAVHQLDTRRRGDGLSVRSAVVGVAGRDRNVPRRKFSA